MTKQGNIPVQGTLRSGGVEAMKQTVPEVRMPGSGESHSRGSGADGETQGRGLGVGGQEWGLGTDPSGLIAVKLRLSKAPGLCDVPSNPARLSKLPVSLALRQAPSAVCGTLHSSPEQLGRSPPPPDANSNGLQAPGLQGPRCTLEAGPEGKAGGLSSTEGNNTPQNRSSSRFTLSALGLFHWPRAWNPTGRDGADRWDPI